MRVFQGFADPSVPRGTVLGIGTFDGVHLGHQAVIREVLTRASLEHTPAALLTFSPHPQAVVGIGPPPLLYTPAEKEQLLAAAGVEILVLQDFDSPFSSLSAEGFISRVLVEGLAPVGVVVGHDFRFGAGAAGDVDLLAESGRERGFEVAAVGEVLVGGFPVRSSLIRDLVASGHVAEAARLLGRPWHLTGPVVRGRGVGRRDLGFPTVNLDPPAKLVPPAGVYVGRAGVRGEVLPAAVNIGRPAERRHGQVEAHLIGFDGDLYGAEVEVQFLDRLREERRFDSPAELALQIGRDVAAVRRYLSGVER